MNHDRLSKELVTVFFNEFLDMFVPALARYVDPGPIESLDKEIFTDILSGQRREADIVVKARFKGQPVFFIIHIENQSRTEPGFPRRMFLYFARLDEKYGLPVFSIAFFTHQHPARAEPNEYRVSFPNKQVLLFNYEVIQLNRLDWRNFLRHKNPLASALMARMKIAPKDRPRVKLECLRLLATFKLNPAKMALIWGYVESYLKLDRSETQQFEKELARVARPEKEKIMQLPNTWIDKGIAKGLEQGKSLGLLEGKQQLVLRLLKSRFGPSSAKLKRSIQALSVNQIDSFAEALLDFPSLAKAREWLANHA